MTVGAFRSLSTRLQEIGRASIKTDSSLSVEIVPGVAGNAVVVRFAFSADGGAGNAY